MHIFIHDPGNTSGYMQYFLSKMLMNTSVWKKWAAVVWDLENLAHKISVLYGTV